MERDGKRKRNLFCFRRLFVVCDRRVEAIVLEFFCFLFLMKRLICNDDSEVRVRLNGVWPENIGQGTADNVDVVNLFVS